MTKVVEMDAACLATPNPVRAVQRPAITGADEMVSALVAGGVTTFFGVPVHPGHGSGGVGY